MRNITKRRLAFALSMALITSSLASAAGILRNYGAGHEFFALWLHTFSVTFPTVVFSILIIAPRMQRLMEKLFPDRKEHPHA